MSDLISRQAVLEYIASWLEMNSYYHPYSKGESIPTSEIKDIVNSVPSVENKGEWIPVSERLPENDGQYLVTYDREDEITVNISYFDRHGFLVGNVLAWQPLPKPYKKVGE